MPLALPVGMGGRSHGLAVPVVVHDDQWVPRLSPQARVMPLLLDDLEQD